MPLERLITTFNEIVQIDSPTGFEKEMGEEVARRLYRFGLQPEIDKKGNVLVFVPGDRQDPLFLGAHLDTVEPGRGIKPKIDNEVIYSSGDTVLGADNKVAVASIIELLHNFQEHSEAQHRPFDVVFTVSEESGNYGAMGLDYSKIKAREGYIFDFSAPVGTIVTASPFYDRFDIELKGKSAHASRPNEANNSVNILGFVLNRIKLGKISANTVVNIGLVTTGEKESVRNTIPGQMMIKGEARSFLEEELIASSDAIRDAFAEGAKYYGSQAQIDFCRENGGYKYSPLHPFLVKTKGKILEVGLKPVFKEAWGCSDGNIFVEKGLTVLNLGDGTRDSHTKRESISIKELDNLYRLITALVV